MACLMCHGSVKAVVKFMAGSQASTNFCRLNNKDIFLFQCKVICTDQAIVTSANDNRIVVSQVKTASTLFNFSLLWSPAQGFSAYTQQSSSEQMQHIDSLWLSGKAQAVVIRSAEGVPVPRQ
jgi:hypothetical protein